jgi:hypothetical protein
LICYFGIADGLNTDPTGRNRRLTSGLWIAADALLLLAHDKRTERRELNGLAFAKVSVISSSTNSTIVKDSDRDSLTVW